MTMRQLPEKQIINKAFKDRGKDNVLMIDIFPVNNGQAINIIFESINSPRRQGVWMATQGSLIVNQQKLPSIDLWQDTAPQIVPIEICTENNCLHLYNIWEDNNRRESQLWSSGMLVEDIPNGRRYFCNDFGFDTDFKKLVFRIERI